MATIARFTPRVQVNIRMDLFIFIFESVYFLPCAWKIVQLSPIHSPPFHLLQARAFATGRYKNESPLSWKVCSSIFLFEGIVIVS